MHGHTYHLSSWALLSICPFGSRVSRLTLKTGASVKACAETPGNSKTFPPHQHWFPYTDQPAAVLAEDSHDWTYTGSNATEHLLFSGTPETSQLPPQDGVCFSSTLQKGSSQALEVLPVQKDSGAAMEMNQCVCVRACVCVKVNYKPHGFTYRGSGKIQHPPSHVGIS